MSTIATDGKILAADSRCCNGTLVSRVRKLMVLSDIAFAWSGQAQDGPIFRDWWLRTGGKSPVRHNEVIPPLSDDFSAIVLRVDGERLIFDNKAVGFHMDSEFHAEGTGRAVAMAAMHCGKDPVAAVALAAQLDCYTGLPIDAVVLRDGRFQSLLLERGVGRDVSDLHMVFVMPGLRPVEPNAA